MDAPIQGASFYVERIDLASKLRFEPEMALESPLSGKSPLTHFKTGQGPKHFEDFIVGIRAKDSQFPANLVEFRVQKGHFHFVTQCYIWAFYGCMDVKLAARSKYTP